MCYSRLFLPYLVFLVSALGYLLASALAHLLHPCSDSAHYLAFYGDFVGIALYSYTSASMFFLYSSTPQFHLTWQTSFLPVAFLLSLLVSGCESPSSLLPLRIPAARLLLLRPE